MKRRALIAAVLFVLAQACIATAFALAMLGMVAA